MEREEGLEGEVHARKMFSKKVIARDAAAPFLEIGINFYTVYGSTVSREREGEGNNGYTGGC